MIHKRKDETELEYIVRMYRNKDIHLMDNNSIGLQINKELNQDLDESAYRKKAQAILDYEEVMREEWFRSGFEYAGGDEDLFTGSGCSDNTNVFNRIVEEEKKVYKMKQVLADTKREMRSMWRAEARGDNLKSVMYETAEIISRSNPIKLTKLPTMVGSKKVAVLSLSDWHFGEVINNYLGDYNSDIFMNKVQKLTSDVIDICKKDNVTDLKVLNLGDLVSGNIHVSTRVANEENVAEQIMVVSEVISNMLYEFAKNINSVELHSTVDNHSRINKKYTDHIEKESFSVFIPWFVESRLSSVGNVKVVKNKIDGVEEEDIGVVDIFDRKAIFTHGHNDRMNENAIKDLILISGVYRPLAVFMGHFHKNIEDEIHGIDIIVNSAMVETGDYAKKIRKSSKSRQKLTIFSQSNGEVNRDCTYYINL